MNTWDEWIETTLAEIHEHGRWRRIRTLDGKGPMLNEPGKSRGISFASNDYLGLSHHPLTVAAGHDALDRWGTGSGSARLIVGARPIHDELEIALADWRHSDAALVTSTGYQANLAVLATFGPGARVISDELNHASIIDGARLGRSEVAVYRHADVDHAAALAASAPGRSLIVTDTVFSMDGDVAPIADLSTAAARYGSVLVLDDAHAVFDTPPLDPESKVIRVGTLSKALGALGGYVAGSRSIIDVLINRARSFIFTTAPTPATMASALAALQIFRSSEGEMLRTRLRDHVETLRPGHSSPIIAVILGPESAATAAASKLAEQGMLVPAIRPPTVPIGTSRLRVALSADHTREQVLGLLRALARLGID
jgi:8-amino-7-oxononanoate synthase